MNFPKIISILLLSAFGSVTLRAQEAAKPDPTVIVKDCIEAMGGETFLRSITTLYTDIKTETEGREVNYITREMLPNKGSFKIVYKGRTVFQNWFDGKKAFETVNGAVKKADLAEFKDKFDRKNIFNELDWIRPELWTLKFLNEEKLGLKDCYKIKATRKSGLVELLYFDKETKLLQRDDKVEDVNKNSFSTTIYLNYQKYSGLTFASEMKIGNKNSLQALNVVELKINSDVSETDFKP
ncbi:outer membrane lipoprotein-sorting protein [Pedobacter sp. KBS0701]|uniref:outer membrane lipoprotein-sorting protein n=1 Tax=Pedobacter sp. KBS0701 TaxID=2578106 RepID=UPI00110F0CF8|nr:outer membrane lipoprotein-sorting protein [Pedobacter sp. KBS0701]QDW24325.1 outer membrane lipoprotein-sorting protein [Pedobacter sp. KBS0701]QDW25246.1 outer membrane lipoprotein-sorting protein [Pedobacter sp. KBS0701]